MNDSFPFLCSSFDSLYADYGQVSGMDGFFFDSVSFSCLLCYQKWRLAAEKSLLPSFQDLNSRFITDYVR